MIGIGVGIDYALFIVTRHRQALDEAPSPGRGNPRHRHLGTGGRVRRQHRRDLAPWTAPSRRVVRVRIGVRHDRGRAAGDGGVYHLAPGHAGLRRARDRSLSCAGDPLGADAGPAQHLVPLEPLHPTASRRVGFSALAVLVVLALPLFSMQLLFADAGNDPSSFTTRKAYDLLAEGFGPGTNGPLVVAVDLSRGGDPAVVNQLASAIGSTPDVAAVVPPQLNTSGDTAVIVAIPR